MKCEYCSKIHSNNRFCSRICKNRWQSTQTPWNKGMKASNEFKELVSLKTKEAMKNVRFWERDIKSDVERCLSSIV